MPDSARDAARTAHCGQAIHPGARIWSTRQSATTERACRRRARPARPPRHTPRWGAMRSFGRTLESRADLELGHRSLLSLGYGTGGAVLLDVFDQPLHLLDLPPLRLAD